MGVFRKYLEAYRLLRKYREGSYAADFAKNNLRNIIFILMFMACILFVNVMIFFLAGSEAVPQYQYLDMFVVCIAFFLGLLVVGYYMRRPFTEKNRKHLRNIFFTATLLMAFSLIHNELFYRGTLYNYIILLFGIAAVPNFTVAEALLLVLFTDASVLLFLGAGGMRSIGEASFWDIVRIVFLATTFYIGLAVRNHVDYLIFMRERSRLKRSSELDPLTGLLNRRGMEAYIYRRKYHWPIVACIIDVDDFKSYNDTYGHEAGNRCLREVADSLVMTAQQSDAIAVRYGGEEFVLLFFMNDLVQAYRLMRNCAQLIEHKKIAAGKLAQHPYVTISGGMVLSPEGPQCDIEKYYEIINEADRKLYVAKVCGKNQIIK